MLRQQDVARGFCSNKNPNPTATRMSSQSHGLELRRMTNPVNPFNPTHVSRNSPRADEVMDEGNDFPTACRHHTAHHCRSGTETVSLVREATCHVRTIRI